LFNEAIALIEPHLEVDEAGGRGSVVIGTVHGDIHDIGKNIVATMLRCAGYSVTDLGVDIAPEVFVARAKETGAGLVALSGLLTSAYDSMKATVEAFSEAGMRDSVKVIIGGGMVNEMVRAYSGADAFGKDPTEAVRLAESLTAAGNGEGHK
jgi:5-methyltetrahydrofolate--homocysteine methyltransferase